MTGYIYKITNNINNKEYIGQTIRDPSIRFKEHIKKQKFALGGAIKKYGIDNFQLEILKKINCDSKEELINKLNELEIKYISKYNTNVPFGYNITKGGKQTSILNSRDAIAKEIKLLDPYFKSDPIINIVTNIYYNDIIDLCFKEQIPIESTYYDLYYNIRGDYRFKNPELVEFKGESFPKNATIKDIIDGTAIRYVRL